MQALTNILKREKNKFKNIFRKRIGFKVFNLTLTIEKWQYPLKIWWRYNPQKKIRLKIEMLGVNVKSNQVKIRNP
jgi:hypothetical protein